MVIHPSSLSRMTHDFNNSGNLLQKVNFLTNVFNNNTLDLDCLKFVKKNCFSIRVELTQRKNDPVNANKSIKLGRIKHALNKIWTLKPKVDCAISDIKSQQDPGYRFEPQPMSSSSSYGAYPYDDVENDMDPTVYDAPHPIHYLQETQEIYQHSETTASEQPEDVFFHQLCGNADEPDQSKEVIEEIIDWLKLLMEQPQGQNKKKIAFKIAQLYSLKKYGISDLDQATRYYQIADREGCDQSYQWIARIANRTQKFDVQIEVLRSRLSIPDAFFSPDALPSDENDLDFNEQDKLYHIRILKQLAAAYQNKKDEVLVTRMLDLAAAFGDKKSLEKLYQIIGANYETQIDAIKKRNRKHLKTTLESNSQHQINEAKQMIVDLSNELKQQGFILTIHQYFLPLITECIANEAFSRYVCSLNSKCTDSRCKYKSLELCEMNYNVNSNNALTAWVRVALEHIVGNSLEVERKNELAAIAIKAGFSDPRENGVSLYPHPSQPSSSTKMSIIDDIVISDDDTLEGEI